MLTATKWGLGNIWISERGLIGVGFRWGRSSKKTRPSQDLFRLRQEHSKRTSSSSYGHRCRDRFAPSVAHEREETEAEIRGRRTRKRRLCRDETDRELCGLTHTLSLSPCPWSETDCFACSSVGDRRVAFSTPSLSSISYHLLLPHLFVRQPLPLTPLPCRTRFPFALPLHLSSLLGLDMTTWLAIFVLFLSSWLQARRGDLSGPQQLPWGIWPRSVWRELPLHRSKE